MKIKNELSKKQDSSLLRFIDLTKLLDLLKSHAFHFTRLDNFDDKSEAISQRQLVKYFNHDLDFPATDKKELPLSIRQQRYFASCWFSADRESFAMWNLYSNSSSVALKISLKSFNSIWLEKNLKFSPTVDWIDSMYINEISYKDYLSIKGAKTFKDETKIIGFQKDESFKHEQEIRVLIKCKNQIETTTGTQNIIKHPIPFFKVTVANFKAIPIEVIFHPMMQDWQKDNIQDLIKRYGYKNISYRDSEVEKLLKPLFKPQEK